MLGITEIKKFIDHDSNSKLKSKARKCQNYYEGKHDIKNCKFFYVDASDNYVEDETRSNIKISHPFFTELADQTVQYMLSGFDSFFTCKDEQLNKRLHEVFDDEFVSELSEGLTNCVVKGFGYMYLYLGSDERLHFQVADTLGVVEVKAKDTESKKDHIIRFYTEFDMKSNKDITKIEVWDQEQVQFFIDAGNGIQKDESEKINPRPHIVYGEDESLYQSKFGFIPFFRIDANRKRTSHLNPIKALIDDYDIIACGLSNNIQDFNDAIYVVKNYQGENLDELIKDIKVKKHVGIDDEGDVDIKTVDIPYEARKIKLELDEKNIYRFGMGFNSAQIGDGNITNIVIKSRYALLDLKCNKLERQLRAFLKQLFVAVINEFNKSDEGNYSFDDVSFDFTREVMTNASDNALIDKTKAETEQITINTLLNIASKFDNETVMQKLCEVLDIDYEEVKDKLPKDNPDLNKLSEKLVVDDEQEAE